MDKVTDNRQMKAISEIIYEIDLLISDPLADPSPVTTLKRLKEKAESLLSKENTPTMANDNQTALMQSISRRKTRLVKLEKLFKEQGYQNLYLDGQIQVMKDEITEDEKLLAVEEKQRDKRDREIIDETWLYSYEEGYVGSHYHQSEILHNLKIKYGTDGK